MNGNLVIPFFFSTMESNPAEEIAHEFLPYFRVYKDGHVQRLHSTETIPPSTDPQTGVQSKDTIFSQENTLSARLFIPKITNQNQKLPIIIYIHGGAFCVNSPFSPLHFTHLVSLVNKANVIVVAIQYRRAPEHPLPLAYDDAWDAIKWVASHVNGDGPETWLNDGHADFEKFFLMVNSAGANFAHNMGIRVGVDGIELTGVKVVGMILMHPFFGNNVGPSELLQFIFPSIKGCNDPRINPVGAGVDLASLGCSRVLVCVASEDRFKDRGVTYYEALKKSGWSGMVEIVESEEQDHVFHLFKPTCEKAEALMEKAVCFINQD